MSTQSVSVHHSFKHMQTLSLSYVYNLLFCKRFRNCDVLLNIVNIHKSDTVPNYGIVSKLILNFLKEKSFKIILSVVSEPYFYVSKIKNADNA